MPHARVARGRKTQELLAEWFRGRGWPEAKAREAHLSGIDIYSMLGLAPEVKATEGQDFTGALRQAVRNATTSALPFVIYRPRGYGPEKIGDWVVGVRLEDFTTLLNAAGYGEGPHWRSLPTLVLP